MISAMSGRREIGPSRERRRWGLYLPLVVLFAMVLFLAGMRTSHVALSLVAALYVLWLTRRD